MKQEFVDKHSIQNVTLDELNETFGCSEHTHHLIIRILRINILVLLKNRYVSLVVER